MTAPKPSADWGRWRLEPVIVAGLTMYPALLNDKDRERIDSRMIGKTHDISDYDDNHD